MKTISFQAFTDAGCIIIFDPSGGFEVTDKWLNSMNHVTDPDGLTCVTADYPEGAWPTVWKQHVARIHELCRNGEFAFLLCDEVEYACQVCDGIDANELGRQLGSFDEWVYAPSGKLVIVDAMAAFSGWDMSEEPFAEIEVTPGWNKVTIYHLQEPDTVAPIIGFEGTTDHPSIVFVPTASPQAPELSSSRSVSRLNATRELAPGVLCEATVSTANDETVKLHLRMSPTIHSGHGHMSVPNSIRLKRGDEVLVRLLENKGAYWSVELA